MSVLQIRGLDPAALTRVGGLAQPSKMPGFSYSLPASECITGRELAKVPGSRCHQCYAMRGHYATPNVKRALRRRFRSLRDLTQWLESMVTLHQELVKRGERWFRWHDSGDIQSVAHLEAIAEIARRVPRMRYWLPTGEATLLRAWARAGRVPRNLTIRLSGPLIDAPAPSWWPWRSTIHRNGNRPIGRACPAHDQGNQCLDCRVCWDRRVRCVSYRKH